MSAERPLYDRETELDSLRGLLAGQDRKSPSIAYVEGHAGMGKTSLITELHRIGEESGYRVLDATGEELERGFGFGVIRQLFERTLMPARGPIRLKGPAEAAEPAFGRQAAAAATSDSPVPVLNGLYWMTAEIAEETPILLSVDDAQWADLSSLRYLVYLATRIERIPVKLVVASRRISSLPGDEHDPAAILINRIRMRNATIVVEPRPLGIDATAAILARTLGETPDRRFAEECQSASAGNPFFLGELAAALEAGGIRPSGAAIDRIEDLGPGSVAESVRARVQALPPAAELVLGAVAVLGSQADTVRVAAMTGIPTAEVSRLADLLARTNLLVDGRPLRFHHPIVNRAVYGYLPAGHRAELHASAARALAAEGAAPEGVGPHLLLSEPVGDAEVVATLRAAAAAATAEGEAEMARTYLERARREPPDPESRAAVLGELGMAEAAVGRDLDRACELLQEAANLSNDQGERVDWIEEAARTRLYGGEIETAARLLEVEISKLGPADGELRLRLTAHLAGIAVLQPAVAEDVLAGLEQLHDLPGSTPAELAVLAELGGRRWQQGRIADASDLAKRALAGGTLLAAEGPVSVAFNHAVAILIDADEHELASESLVEGIALAGRRGSLLGVASLISLRATMAWRRGDLEGVISEARVSLDLLEESRTPMVNPNVLGYLALALIERGELEEAERALTAFGDPRDLPTFTFLVAPFLAWAKLELARSRAEEAIEILLSLERRQEELGVLHMSVPWGYTAVEAALAAGRDELAIEIADRQLERTELWDLPSARGQSLAASGLARGGEEGVELLAEGVKLMERSPARLDLVRASIGLGSMLRRMARRVEARDPLRRGLDEASRCGAVVLADRAERELVTAGAKPRRRQFSGADSLTAGERRVALLAARGASNREIAATLTVSVRTVENHLGRCYRKLDISSRERLQSVLDP